MKIEQDKLKELVDKLNGFTNRQCPLCGGKKFSVFDSVYEMREYQKGKIGNNLIPVIPLTCETCGNTFFVNAIKIGVLEKEPEKGGSTT